MKKLFQWINDNIEESMLLTFATFAILLVCGLLSGALLENITLMKILVTTSMSVILLFIISCIITVILVKLGKIE